MAKKIVISQQTSSAWRTIILISSLIAVLFIIFSAVFKAPLWSGIFRLIVFIAFASGVIGFLHGRKNTDKIVLQIDAQLTITYFRRGKKSQKEFFELDTVKKIETKPAPAVFKIIPRKDVVMLQISFTDTDKSLSLLRFEGRNLFVSSAEADRTQMFIEKHIHG